jgi:hypothetical protein
MCQRQGKQRCSYVKNWADTSQQFSAPFLFRQGTQGTQFAEDALSLSGAE